MGKFGGGSAISKASASNSHSILNSDEAKARQQARRDIEKQGGFDWTPVMLLGVMGATALFSFDRAYQKKEEEEKKREEREEKEKNRSRGGDSSRGKGGYDSDEERRRRRRRRREEEEDRHRGRGRSEGRHRHRDLDDWEDERRDVDEHGFYVSSGRSRGHGGHERYEERSDRHGRAHDRGYSDDYDRHGRPARERTW